MHQSNFNSYLILGLHRERERCWRFWVKLREITLGLNAFQLEDRRLGIWEELLVFRRRLLWVVEFNEKEKNKEDQGGEVCGNGWLCGGK